MPKLTGTAGKLWARIYPKATLAELTLPPCARGLKVFIYDLPAEWNSDLLEHMEKRVRVRSNCDYARSPCIELQRDDEVINQSLKWSGYSNHRQYAAEVPLLAKFLQMPLQTSDPAQADLFVVPSVTQRCTHC